MAVADPADHPRLPYLPALDGVRGIAVAAVLLFHADVTWAKGGHLGVTSFFTLSGFLITSLLLVEKHAKGTIALRDFWARRARRLVPAIIVCFALIAAVVAAASSAPPRGLVGDAVSASVWGANWRYIFIGRSYGDLFALPSPFQHFWSLAVEEQFYVIFPLLALVVLGWRTQRLRKKRFAVLLFALVVFSTLQAAMLHTPDAGIARAYYGTDARMAEILVGSLLALALVRSRGIAALGPLARRVTGAVGVAGLVGLGVAFNRLGDHDTRLYEGGFLAVALCTAAVITSATQPGSALGRLLAQRPAVALGKISYGAYLFHWPIFILLSASATGLSPAPLFAARIGLTLALASLSYVLIETPVRRGVLPSDLARPAWASAAVGSVAAVALVAGHVPLPQATSATQVNKPQIAAATTATKATGAHVSPTGDDRARSPAVAPRTTTSRAAAAPGGFFDDPSAAPPPTVPAAPPKALRVTMLGDSLGHNLGNGLTAWANSRKDVVLQNLAVAGCPLSRGGVRRFRDGEPFPVAPACSWWDDPSSERYAALERFHPKVLVVQDGGSEIFDRKLPDWSNWRRPGDPRFDSWLQDEYRTAISGWAEKFGANIVVTNAACGDWQRYTAFPQDSAVRVRTLNQSVYPSLPDVTLADLFRRICPGGQYSDDVEGVHDGRPDGFHISDEAATALARNWLGPIVLRAATSRPSSGPVPIG